MEAPDPLAGVTCCGKGCTVVFSAADPAAHASTTGCGHSLCGTCALLFVLEAGVSVKCPLCDALNPMVRPNPGLSEHGDKLLAMVRDAAGCDAAVAQGGCEEHACFTCDGDGVPTVATFQCTNCDKFFCSEDAPRHANKAKHVINPLKPGIADPAAICLQLSICGTHGLALDMFCVGCCEALCAKCAFAEHQGHKVTGINEVTDLASKVHTFWQTALDRAASADASGVDVAAARANLAACRQRVITEVAASKTTALKIVSDHFDHLLAIVNTEADERDKALASQERECSLTAAQLRAGCGVCESATNVANNIALASALHTADLMAPMLKPFPGLVAATDMDVVVDLAPLSTALLNVGRFEQFPVDASTSEVTSDCMPTVVDASAVAAGGVDAAADASVFTEDVNTVTLIPRGAAGNIVRLRDDEVKLRVCDAEGREVGISSVAVYEDGSVHMQFRIDDPKVREAVITVTVRGAVLKWWTSQKSMPSPIGVSAPVCVHCDVCSQCCVFSFACLKFVCSFFVSAGTGGCLFR